MRGKQLSLIPKKTPKHYGITKDGKRKKKPGRKLARPANSFGGAYSKGYNPSQERPINGKKALHLVLRSSRAKGKFALNHKDFDGPVWDIILKHAARNNIRLYEYANAGNHLHLLLRAKNRSDYKRFIRSITGLIARLVLGAQRGAARGGKFWDGRPFTRIVSFGKRDFENVKSYITRNMLEAIGWLPYFRRSQKMPDRWYRFWKSTFSVPIYTDPV